MELTVFVFIGLGIVSTFTGNNSLSLSRPMVAFCTVYPQGLYSTAVEHGLEDCIEDCLFSGIIAVTVINNAENRQFLMQSSKPCLMVALYRHCGYTVLRVITGLPKQKLLLPVKVPTMQRPMNIKMVNFIFA